MVRMTAVAAGIALLTVTAAVPIGAQTRDSAGYDLADIRALGR